LAEKKDWPFKLSVKEKKAMIDPTHAVISIARQCELIQLSRASYYRDARKLGTDAIN